MDRLIYTTMSGARHALERQATTSQNLANTSTTGYRAQTSTLRSVAVAGEGLPTRAFVLEGEDGTNFAPGAIQKTGRDLDVAIEGSGFIAVQGADGREAYTRNGSFQVGPNGLLQTRSGLSVLGDGGTIAIPPDVQITVGKDGTVSAVPNANGVANVTALGRIKLVNPPEQALARGGDGLFRMRDGTPAPASAEVKVVGAAVESSNVNVVEAMVEMISLSRQFDTHMKMLQNAEQNDREASQILATR